MALVENYIKPGVTSRLCLPLESHKFPLFGGSQYSFSLDRKLRVLINFSFFKKKVYLF